MRKLSVLASIIGILLIIGSNSYGQKPDKSDKSEKTEKIGFVNVETIVKELPEAIDADKKIKDLGKKYQDSLQKLQTELEDRYKQYEKQRDMLAPEIRQKEEEAMKAMQVQLYQFREQKFGQQGELAQMQERFLQPIRDKIKKAISSVAKDEKLVIVLDNSNAAVLFAEDKYDITYRVLDKIKRGVE